MRNRRLQSGQIGERMAEAWFLNNGWHMTRSQPAIQILGSKPGKRFGRIFTVRMIGRGGVPDYTGFVDDYPTRWNDETKEWEVLHNEFPMPLYRACEVKEAVGDSMPCSRLDKEQRDFLAALPKGCAWTGVFWVDTQKFEMYPFVKKGSYKKS